MAEGRVFKVESNNIYVTGVNGIDYRCSVRGRLKNSFNLKKDKLYNLDIVVVGDYVGFDVNDDGTGVIEEVKERRTSLSRKSPRIKGAGYRGERLEQVVAANIDNLYIITSVYDPVFNNRLLDRLIVTGESSHLNIHIIVNKTDLDDENLITPWAEIYEDIGYPVYYTSVEENSGFDNIKNDMHGKTSIFWGQSGVGKSSLLNVLFPELDLKVGEISDLHRKGKHTTVTALLVNPENDINIIDTPGIREIEPYGIKKEDLGHYFIEFTEYMHDCKFNTCTHFHEPGCMVREAVEEGNINQERYLSYLALLETIEEDINF